ncbi:MAG: hypothetical protein ACE5I8_04960 [Thermodesulfobacteriota bacterium]
MKEEKKKKKYEKPKIIYRKEIETLAAYCDSNWGGLSGCRTGYPCTRLIT